MADENAIDDNFYEIFGDSDPDSEPFDGFSSESESDPEAEIQNEEEDVEAEPGPRPRNRQPIRADGKIHIDLNIISQYNSLEFIKKKLADFHEAIVHVRLQNEMKPIPVSLNIKFRSLFFLAA
jgi:hypothetical protein